MAWAFKGPIVGFTRATGAAGSFTGTFTTGYATGDVVVAWVGSKGTGTTGSNTDFAITDSVGNSWVRAGAFKSGGTAANATNAQIFYAHVTAAIASGTTVVLSGPAGQASGNSAWTIGGFTKTAGNTVSLVAATGTSSIGGVNIISGSLAGLTAGREYLFLAALGNRCSAVISISGDTTNGCTLGAATSTGVAGLAPATGQVTHWNYDIATATGITNNTSGLVTTGAKALMLVALVEEVPPTASVPSTSYVEGLPDRSRTVLYQSKFNTPIVIQAAVASTPITAGLQDLNNDPITRPMRRMVAV